MPLMCLVSFFSPPKNFSQSFLFFLSVLSIVTKTPTSHTHTHRHTHTHSYTQTHIQRERERYTDTNTHTDTHSERERETDRHSRKERGIHRDRERHRKKTQRNTEKDRQTDRHRHRERERHASTSGSSCITIKRFHHSWLHQFEAGRVPNKIFYFIHEYYFVILLSNTYFTWLRTWHTWYLGTLKSSEPGMDQPYACLSNEKTGPTRLKISFFKRVQYH